MKSVIRGMLLLGKGKKEGIDHFSNTSEGVLNAIAPWLAIPVVFNLLPLLLLQEKNLKLIYINIVSFLVSICCLLSMIVIVHFYAQLWKKEDLWKTTTISLLWCRWLPLIDYILAVMIITVLFSGFINILLFLMGIITILYIAYTIWLNWFVLKTGLQVSTGQSIITLISIGVAIIFIYGIFILCNIDYITQQIEAIRQVIAAFSKAAMSK